ncbi:MAG: cupin domain-containing protein [Planctomycetota bacterium]
MDKVNLKQKLDLFSQTWTPKIVGTLNGQEVKLAKLEGEFLWHTHDEEDEMFLLLEGALTIRFRDRDDVVLEVGEMLIVPRGMEHLPIAPNGASVLLIEPAGTGHTGSIVSDRTVVDQEWI